MSHLLPEQILDINYYLSEMTMFLKESYGVTDRFKRTYYSLITKLDEIGQKYLDLLNAFVLENDYDKLIDKSTYPEFQDKYISVENPEEGELYHYFEKQGDKYVLTEDEYIVPNKTYYTISCPLVELWSSLAGINRDIRITYFDEELETPAYVSKNITLTSTEMIILSKFRFYELNYDGTLEGLLNTYNHILNQIKVYYISTSALTVSIIVTLENINEDYLPNLKNVFKDENYLIKSLGIKYSINSIGELNNIFRFRENSGYIIVANPVVEDLYKYYEYIDNKMVLTKDTEIVSGKTYYEPQNQFVEVDNPTNDNILLYYELIDGKYVKTTDTTVDQSKTYYTLEYHDYLNDVRSKLL